MTISPTAAAFITVSFSLLDWRAGWDAAKVVSGIDPCAFMTILLVDLTHLGAQRGAGEGELRHQLTLSCLSALTGRLSETRRPLPTC